MLEQYSDVEGGLAKRYSNPNFFFSEVCTVIGSEGLNVIKIVNAP